ncbi:MAG: hypothetical protein IJS66_06510 [Bacteroidales bacterium]|nr:hypothetical protein [Bacteroidales bacterium]
MKSLRLSTARALLFALALALAFASCSPKQEPEFPPQQEQPGGESPDNPGGGEQPDNPGGGENPDVPGGGGEQPDNPDTPDTPDQPDTPGFPELELNFTGVWEDLYKGESTQVSCSLTGGDPNAEHELEYLSSAPGVASITQDGVLKALSPGSTLVSVGVKGTGLRIERTYYVVDLHQLKSQYSPELVMFKGQTIYYKSVMQSWDFFDDWFYVCQVCGAPHTLTFTRKPVLEETPQTYMHLRYYGHGDNIFVERCPDGDYLWVSNYGTLESGATNRYSESQVLSRVKFVPGALLLPADAHDNYLIPGMKKLIAAFDEDNGRVAIWSRDASGQAWINVYDKKVLQALPQEDIQLSYSISYGSPVVTERPVVRGRNLLKTTPLHKFKLPFNGAPQGFDYHHDKVYFFRGSGAEAEDRQAGTGRNRATAYYINTGSKILVQVNIPWVDDVQLLNDEGLTDLGYFEPEGIKVKDGVIYLGFASKDAGDSPERRVNIFKYPIYF